MKERKNQIKINDMNLSIKQSFYNKSTIEEDGITHKIDTDKEYPLYVFELNKIYLDETREETVNKIINDLEEVVSKLKQIKEHNELEL